MFGRFRQFIAYNNAVPVLFGILFLSVGSVFAANPDVRANVAESIYAERARTVSVDNTYLLETDMDRFVPTVQILEVTEDETNYYVTYELETIDLLENIWQPVIKTDTMTVAKGALRGKDLGLYVSRELGQLIDAELSLLRETQRIEEGIGKREKVVATEYSGLVGRFLDPTEERFPGYEPQIPPDERGHSDVRNDPAAERETDSEDALRKDADEEESENETPEDGNGQQGSGSGSSSGGGGSSPPGDVVSPTIQILGDNPTYVARGATYDELGIVATDNTNTEVTTEKVGTVDTNTVGEYSITYIATDGAGNQSTAVRTVIVEERGTSTDETGTTTPGGTEEDSATSSNETGADPDTTAPVISLIGADEIMITEGDTFTDPGATAEDETDGDLTDSISRSGVVDTGTEGTYTIIYSVTDAAENEASVERVVIVEAEESEPDTTPDATSSVPKSTTTDQSS